MGGLRSPGLYHQVVLLGDFIAHSDMGWDSTAVKEIITKNKQGKRDRNKE